MAMKVVVAVCLLSLAYCDDVDVTDCHMADNDVGGETNACGYMPVIAVIAAEGEEKPAWLNGYFKTVHADELDAMHCQDLCEKMPDCAYWYFSSPDPHADCTLKMDYSLQQKTDAGGECSPLYETGHVGGHAGPKRCPSCHRVEQDVGGDQNACGFTPIIHVLEKFGATTPGWYGGTVHHLPEGEEINGVMCQDHCAHTPFCLFWHASSEHCYLQGDYTREQKEAAGGSCEPMYQPHDQGVSGPKYCHGGASCSHLKHHYKDHQCCGNPTHMVELPF